VSICSICKQKPSCASIAFEDDGKLWLNVPTDSAVGNTIPLRYEVVPPPQPETFMPYAIGEICDACVRGYGGVGMLVDPDDSPVGEVDAALREAREVRAKYEFPGVRCCVSCREEIPEGVLHGCNWQIGSRGTVA